MRHHAVNRNRPTETTVFVPFLHNSLFILNFGLIVMCACAYHKLSDKLMVHRTVLFFILELYTLCVLSCVLKETLGQAVQMMTKSTILYRAESVLKVQSYTTFASLKY